MANRIDDDDPFEEISNLNKKSYDEGFAEGVVSGKKEAFVQGFKMGQKTSFNISNEVGQIYGACKIYKLLYDQKQTSNKQIVINEKGFKVAEQICELIEKFNLADCHDKNFITNLNHIKDKFKQFSSITNMKNHLKEEHSASASMKFDF